MKRWAILVAALYCLILAVLMLPVGMLAFGDKGMILNDAAEAYGAWQTWIYLLVMGLSQLALLAVPVRFASRRPVSRGPVLSTVLASGLMMGGMVAGAWCAIYEFAKQDAPMPVAEVWCLWGGMALTWFLWSLVFYRLGMKQNPDDFISRQSRLLLAGSILELLIAVPTHIVARHRNYCCAGFGTFIGLAMGISVMLFSFGPAVFFLFVARWRRLHPHAAENGGSWRSSCGKND